MIEEVDIIVDHVSQIIDPVNWGMRKVGAEVKAAMGQFIHRPIGSVERAQFHDAIERVLVNAIATQKIIDYRIAELPKTETLTTDFLINIIPCALAPQYVIKLSIG